MAWKIAIILVGLALAGCGDLERDNSLDPRSTDFIGDLGEALVGEWSLETLAMNQVYTFKIDNTVQLYDYSSPSGGPVDRSASYPDMLLIRFSGTYSVVGNFLRISFTEALSNEPGAASPSLPPSDLRAEISIRGNTLTMKDSSGERIYTRTNP